MSAPDWTNTERVAYDDLFTGTKEDMGRAYESSAGSPHKRFWDCGCVEYGEGVRLCWYHSGFEAGAKWAWEQR